MNEAGIGSFVSFDVGAARAALPLGLVREVVECPAIVPVPGSHPHVAGVVMNGGMAVPVYDLRRLARFWDSGLPAGGATRDHLTPNLIVIGLGEILVALLGAQVDLLDHPEPDSSGVEEESVIRGEFVKGMLKAGARRVAVLDSERLFASLGVPADIDHNAGEDEGEEDPAGR